jgi:hypothetical protein
VRAGFARHAKWIADLVKARLPVVACLLMTVLLAGCRPRAGQATVPAAPISSQSAPVLPPIRTATQPAMRQPSSIFNPKSYEFPAAIDPAKRYLFYLHGKIIEDQGLPAVSPEFGEYEYGAILEKLAGYDLVVISEQRPVNTDALAYAQRVVRQVGLLLDAGVPARNITVLGASKGAAIAVLVSSLLKNPGVNYVLLGTCHPDQVQQWQQQRLVLTGNVLSIYDFADSEYSGSCQELFKLSEGQGLGRHDEIVLQVGSGHGVLYKPLDEWVIPAGKWSQQETP